MALKFSSLKVHFLLQLPPSALVRPLRAGRLTKKVEIEMEDDDDETGHGGLQLFLDWNGVRITLKSCQGRVLFRVKFRFHWATLNLTFPELKDTVGVDTTDEGSFDFFRALIAVKLEH